MISIANEIPKMHYLPTTNDIIDYFVHRGMVITESDIVDAIESHSKFKRVTGPDGIHRWKYLHVDDSPEVRLIVSSDLRDVFNSSNCCKQLIHDNPNMVMDDPNLDIIYVPSHFVKTQMILLLAQHMHMAAPVPIVILAHPDREFCDEIEAFMTHAYMHIPFYTVTSLADYYDLSNIEGHVYHREYYDNLIVEDVSCFTPIFQLLRKLT
jgi:hypothetical protein